MKCEACLELELEKFEDIIDGPRPGLLGTGDQAALDSTDKQDKGGDICISSWVDQLFWVILTL